MKIRRAEPPDLVAVAAIAEGASQTAFAGLLLPHTVSGWIEAAYSPATLRQRWEDHPIYLVIEDQQIIAFADTFIEDDQVVVSAICTHPAFRRQGAATLLLEWIHSLAPPLPIIADVILGSHAAESFYERMGFVPGETMQVMLFGEQLIERRWWLGPRPHPTGDDRYRTAGFMG